MVDRKRDSDKKRWVLGMKEKFLKSEVVSKALGKTIHLNFHKSKKDLHIPELNEKKVIYH